MFQSLALLSLSVLGGGITLQEWAAPQGCFSTDWSSKASDPSPGRARLLPAFQGRDFFIDLIPEKGVICRRLLVMSLRNSASHSCCLTRSIPNISAS